ncbi:T-lymphocyte activation antigen CD80-like isoform X2 [Hyla sarda]|uniref:T-lymphocyte activation antigen CD80-like isoform X2 n=1 Tax=Hyla sarda TaxID=327740 RepID=UPI0024C22364|nr:T-lymphocyte activation antigen CD80-like isoform X2 [Hyla sarda]
MESYTRVPGIVLCYLTLGCRFIWGVVGPLQGSVELPCVHHQPSGSIEEFTVYWQKKNVPEDLVVATIIAGKVDTRYVSEIFRGRAHFNPEGLQDGNYNLTLSNLSLQDSGEYKCIRLRNTNQDPKITETQLEVREFSTPVVGDVSSTHKLPTGNEWNLTCTSKGGLELPRIIWINATDGREVRGGRVHKDIQQIGDLINVTSTITLNITSTINISCVIVTKNGNVTSEPYKMEVTEEEERSSPHTLMVSLIIGGVVAVALTVILVKWGHINSKCPPSYRVPNNQTEEL